MLHPAVRQQCGKASVKAWADSLSVSRIKTSEGFGLYLASCGDAENVIGYSIKSFVLAMLRCGWVKRRTSACSYLVRTGDVAQ